MPSAGLLGGPRYDGLVADDQQQPLAQQLEEIGVQLDWVRDYL
jgi:hypothetical protein